MLFKDYHIPMIRSGSKTVTRREWDENYSGPNPGSVTGEYERIPPRVLRAAAEVDLGLWSSTYRASSETFRVVIL